MSTAGFFLGGMLGRIAGPIAQDWFRYETKLGRKIAFREEEAKKRMALFELDNKKELSQIDHEKKMAQLEKQSVDARKRAEEQMLLSRQDWQQKIFWEKCFPLRNPYEMPLGYKPLFKEGSDRIVLNTVSIANNKEIVPLRVITAVKETSSGAATFNAELSMFIVNHFAANGIHAVISDIGSWRDDAPINDASINYLFQGAKGQPTLVIMPLYTNGGNTVRLKVWSWGLGEDLPYPKGFDYGWYNIKAIQRKVLYSEIKEFARVIRESKMIMPSTFERDVVKKLDILTQSEQTLSNDDFDRLLTVLDVPTEINDAVERQTNEIISTIFSCLTGMCADGYHLTQYGTLPLLPHLMNTLPGVSIMLPYIRDYYRALIYSQIKEGVISIADAANVEMLLAKEIKRIVDNSDLYEDLVSDVRKLNFSIEGDVHRALVNDIREFNKGINLKQITNNE
ncbi:MAG: hypothetical protein IKH33_01430 [Bacteroidales bacterium]|nr:hypothetical protein [Bacteroidales bacterium]